MPKSLDAVLEQYEKEIAQQTFKNFIENMRGKQDPKEKLASELQSGRCCEPYQCLDAELRLSNF